MKPSPWLGLYLFFYAGALLAVTPGTLSREQKKVLDSAETIFKRFQISYVYGGSELGDASECEACNECLAKMQPKANLRLSSCPVCSTCSLDCSHFTQLVLKNSGFYAPYLTSKLMAELPSGKLLANYRLIDLGQDLNKALPGDLLVFNGHVVLLTKVEEGGRGDIIHATGGRDLKGPGQGLQKERMVGLANFRGPLLRVLRHKALIDGSEGSRPAKLRPVIKKQT